MNRAPYFLQTDFIALKYPFGAARAPVVAPTTVSATTTFAANQYMPNQVKGMLTSNNGIWTQCDEFIL